jgi:hypothetical protein
MTVVVRRAVVSDPLRIAERLRVEDAQECLVLGLQPSVMLASSLAASHEAWAAEIDGCVIALWGYGAAGIFGEAEAWLLTAPEIEQHKKLFLTLNQEFLAYVLSLHGSVMCHVHVEYARAVRWLAWLGFQQTGTISVNGAPFHQMRLRRH